MTGTAPPDLAGLVSAYVRDTGSDLYLFNGGVEPGPRSADALIDAISGKSQRRKNVSLFLTTYGGDPDAAFRMIRCLRKSYDRVRLLIVGPCKSAGTLIAVGAHELAFAPAGELGPLDIQVVKPDEAGAYGSGLDIFTALNILTSHAVEKFEEYVETVLNGPLGNLSTKTVSDLAVRLATGVLTPIAAQIDPLRLGETQRAMNILREYGRRIGSDNLQTPTALDRLIEHYPSHPFVIDRDECAERLFKNVGDLTDAECALNAALTSRVRYPLALPGRQALFLDLGDMYPPTPENINDGDTETAGGSTKDSAADGPGTERGAGATELAPNARRSDSDSAVPAGLTSSDGSP